MTTSRTYDGFNRLTGISSTPLLVAAAPIGARNSSSALESAPTVENPFQSPNVLPAACPSRADVAVRAPITDAGGNHNVVAYISAATGAIVAEYDYGPFGELLRATGPLAKDFNFLFSTKYYDWETGLYYYGYRYYNPTTGRWPSRDPIGERGGINLYGFVYNNPVNRFDGLGLDANTPSSTIAPWELGWEWLTGNGPRHRDFGPGDYMTEGLRQHGHIKDSIDDMKRRIFGSSTFSVE